MSFFQSGRFNGPVIASPFFETKEPASTEATAESTYALLTASVLATGAGTVGGTENSFVPAIVSVPLMCTTLASTAFPATALSTASRDIGEAVPDPGVARTAPIVVGD